MTNTKKELSQNSNALLEALNNNRVTKFIDSTEINELIELLESTSFTNNNNEFVYRINLLKAKDIIIEKLTQDEALILPFAEFINRCLPLQNQRNLFYNELITDDLLANNEDLKSIKATLIENSKQYTNPKISNENDSPSNQNESDTSEISIDQQNENSESIDELLDSLSSILEDFESLKNRTVHKIESSNPYGDKNETDELSAHTHAKLLSNQTQFLETLVNIDEAINEDLEQLKMTIGELETKLNNAQIENKRLNEASSKKSETASLKNFQLSTEKNELINSIQKLYQAAYPDDKSDLTKTPIKKLLGSLLKPLQELKKQNSDLKNNLIESIQLNNEISYLNDLLKDSKNEKLTLELNVKELTKEVDDLTESTYLSDEKINNLVETIERLNNEITSLKNSYKVQSEELTNENKELNINVLELASFNKKLDDALNDSVNTESTYLSDEKINTLLKTIQSLNNKITSLENSYEKQSKELTNTFNEELIKLSLQNGELTSENEALRSDLSQPRKEAEASKGELNKSIDKEDKQNTIVENTMFAPPPSSSVTMSSKQPNNIINLYTYEEVSGAIINTKLQAKHFPPNLQASQTIDITSKITNMTYQVNLKPHAEFEISLSNIDKGNDENLAFTIIEMMQNVLANSNYIHIETGSDYIKNIAKSYIKYLNENGFNVECNLYQPEDIFPITIETSIGQYQKILLDDKNKWLESAPIKPEENRLTLFNR